MKQLGLSSLEKTEGRHGLKRRLQHLRIRGIRGINLAKQRVAMTGKYWHHFLMGTSKAPLLRTTEAERDNSIIVHPIVILLSDSKTWVFHRSPNIICYGFPIYLQVLYQKLELLESTIPDLLLHMIFPSTQFEHINILRTALRI